MSELCWPAWYRDGTLATKEINSRALTPRPRAAPGGSITQGLADERPEPLDTEKGMLTSPGHSEGWRR
jgi:hypothetical protein